MVALRQEEEDVLYRVLQRGSGADAEGDASALSDYFNLSTSLTDLYAHFTQRDERHAGIGTGGLINPKT